MTEEKPTARSLEASLAIGGVAKAIVGPKGTALRRRIFQTNALSAEVHAQRS
ncbi:MAG: hypothetical protein AAGC77_13105 [Pseudomonadota bacterium]